MSIFFILQRNCRSGSNPSEAFRFLVEERIVCQQTQKAKYTQRVDYIVQLPVPMDQATNTGEQRMRTFSATLTFSSFQVFRLGFLFNEMLVVVIIIILFFK